MIYHWRTPRSTNWILSKIKGKKHTESFHKILVIIFWKGYTHPSVLHLQAEFWWMLVKHKPLNYFEFLENKANLWIACEQVPYWGIRGEGWGGKSAWGAIGGEDLYRLRKKRTSRKWNSNPDRTVMFSLCRV